MSDGIELSDLLGRRASPGCVARSPAAGAEHSRAPLLVAHADYALARTTRAAAEDLVASARSWNGPVRFRGAWVFSSTWSLAVFASSALTTSSSIPVPLLLLPARGANVSFPPDSTSYAVVGTRRYPVAGFASTFSPERGSGFYCDRFAPVPFVFMRGPAEQYFLLEIVRRIPLQMGEGS